MAPRPRLGAFLATGLAVFFWWGFEFAKHDQILRKIIPFGEDPYDAVSSFGAIAVVILALVSLVRSNFPQWAGQRPIYALRAQTAISFCILVTIAAETVAMARHRSMWAGMPGSGRVLVLETSLAGFAAAMLALTRDGQFGSRSLFSRAAAVWLATLLMLALYPERFIVETPGHLLTVLLGAVFLFAPVSSLVKAWLPGTSEPALSNRRRQTAASRYAAFAAAVAIGSLIGACAYVAEVGEGGVLPPFTRILFVGGVFVGLGTCGVTIGYAFLGRLLGFGRSA
jgi:hypothetical protein